MTLTAEPQGLNAPRWRIRCITRSTFVGSWPRSALRRSRICGFRYGLNVSTCAKPLIPASVTIRTTGLLPSTAHLTSVIFNFGSNQVGVGVFEVDADDVHPTIPPVLLAAWHTACRPKRQTT